MIDRLDAIKAKFTDLGVALTNPAVVADTKKFVSISKETAAWKKLCRPVMPM